MTAAVVTGPSAAERRRGPARGRVQKQRNISSADASKTATDAAAKRRGERVGERKAASLRVLAEPNKWQRMDWLRVNSARQGQKLCGLAAAVDEVTVQRTKRGVNFGGLLTCNSRTCPSCGPRIAAGTRTEIEAAIDAWMKPGHSNKGHDSASSSLVDEPLESDVDGENRNDVRNSRSLWFGTFTIRHKKGQPFKELADGVSAAWGAAKGGRGWMKDREQHGIAHDLRIFEQKWSERNGWHIHVHVLFFIDDTYLDDIDHKPLLATMFKRWAAKAVSLGLGVPLIRAQDLHQVDGAGALDRIAGYFAKETTDATEQYAGSIAAEMSNAAGKQGLTSLTPGQILAWAMQGEDYISQLWGRASDRKNGRGISGQEYAKYLYAEFEKGMKGRRTIAWSHGMREALGLAAKEPTEAELVERAEAADAITRDTLVSMSGQEWQKFNARPGRRAELYAVAQTLDPGELVGWLAGFGVHAVPHRKDRHGTATSAVFFTDDPLPF